MSRPTFPAPAPHARPLMSATRCPTCRAVRAAMAQSGGTFLGLLVGLFLGLAVALGVAIYVTKVPVPFVDRMISRTAEEDAAEAERNRNWNPNATLGGKAAQRPAAEAAPAAAEADAQKPAAEAPPPAAAAAPKESAVPASGDGAPPSVTGKTYSTDPLGDLAQSKSQGKTVAATAPARADGTAAAATEPFLYFVQVGAFRTPEDAQAQRAKLALMGLDAKVSEREQSGRTVYRVRLGPFDRLPDAEKMKEDLQPSGLETALVRVQR